MEPAGTNPSTELHHLGDSHVDSVTNNTTGCNTLYEGNVRSQEKSHPGDLNGAPRGQAERGLGDFSSENIAQEVRNINDENDHATTRKAPTLPGELIEPGYNTEASDRNIAREAQNINDENDHATIRKSPHGASRDEPVN